VADTSVRPELTWQASLFGGDEPQFDAAFSTMRRISLDADAWVDVAQGWVSGADSLFETVLEEAPWVGHQMRMYERVVDQPRLSAHWEEAPPLFDLMRESLSDRYGVEFVSIGFNLYRDGRDSVAFHGDRVARELPAAIVAIVSLGGRRKFQLRPKRGGRSLSLWLGTGDLLVMGGSCQRTWDHGVPKMARAEPRVSVQFRHAYD
jgi:alkylated DNA repair dioxygenase AlkB